MFPIQSRKTTRDDRREIRSPLNNAFMLLYFVAVCFADVAGKKTRWIQLSRNLSFLKIFKTQMRPGLDPKN
jgi:hypothetical protein